MKKFMAILLCITLVMPFASSTNVEAVSKDYNYSNSKINLNYTRIDKEMTVTIDNKKYVVTCDFIVDYAAPDINGTIWLQDEYDNIYWLNRNNYQTVHYFTNGDLMFIDQEEYLNGFMYPDKQDVAYYLPTPDELQSILNGGQYKPKAYDIYFSSDDTPSPTTPPSSTSKPNSNSDKKSSGSSDKTGSKNAYSKVKVKGNTISLLNKKNKAVKKATLNKKTGVMKYNKKKVKGVKSASFSKKGSLVYLTKGKKAYYYIGKKRILIKKKVSAIKTDAKKFAVYLKLKNGKKVKISR